MIENIKSILNMYLIFLFKREIPTVFKRKSPQRLTTLFTIWNESTLPFKLLFYPLYCHVDRRTVNPTDCTRTPLYFILGYSPEECKWGKAGSLGRGEFYFSSKDAIIFSLYHHVFMIIDYITCFYSGCPLSSFRLVQSRESYILK